MNANDIAALERSAWFAEQVRKMRTIAPEWRPWVLNRMWYNMRDHSEFAERLIAALRRALAAEEETSDARDRTAEE